MSNRRLSRAGNLYDPAFIGLEVRTYPCNKQWQVSDVEYIDRLKDLARSSNPKVAITATEALRWLSRFLNESVGARVSRKDPNRLHNTEELIRECYAANNASNRCLTSIRNPQSLTDITRPLIIDLSLTEDQLINAIDSARKTKSA